MQTSVKTSRARTTSLETISIDCDGVASEAQFWQRYLDEVNPVGADIFGRNLDAFWDAVERGGPGWPGGASLRFTSISALVPLRDGLFLKALQEIARDATATRISLVETAA